MNQTRVGGLPQFKDANLLQQALTHRSYGHPNLGENAADNERLEFMGDMILNYTVSDHLYRRFAQLDEGDLTSLRARLVSRGTLAEFARQLAIAPQLRMAPGTVQEGGRENDAILAGAFEALIGALYFDQGMAATQDWVLAFIEPETERVFRDRLDRHPKGALQELAQARLRAPIEYSVLSEMGPDHAKQFIVAVMINGREHGRGEGSSKHLAELTAARNALSNWKIHLNCDQARALFEEALDAEWSGEVIAQTYPDLQIHLDYCPLCRVAFAAEHLELEA